jgi:hypothetical protein
MTFPATVLGGLSARPSTSVISRSLLPTSFRAQAHFLKSLELYGQTMTERTTLILSTDSDLYRYLESSQLGR